MKHRIGTLLLLLLLGGGRWIQDDEEKPMPRPFEAFEAAALVERAVKEERTWLLFLERESLECGIYRLPAGGKDGQKPHDDDEIYYVLAGRARFTAGGEVCDVKRGSVLYVAKHVEHRFHHIEEDLEVLVVFARGPK